MLRLYKIDTFSLYSDVKHFLDLTVTCGRMKVESKLDRDPEYQIGVN